jgi:polyvinyl alcohol dehydrogenase (cytochrome)
MVFPPLLAALAFLVALAAPAGAALTPDNVARLALKWEVPLSSVTGGPMVVGDVVYVPSWDDRVYALDVRTGAQRWAFLASGPLGIPGAVLPIGDKICFGTSGAQVFCLNRADGTLLWQRSLAELAQDAIWSQLASANGRLFAGIASISDNPCTKGRLVALDLETGAPLWEFQTVPDKICSTDTAVACSSDAECAGGTCMDALGAGVTATVSFDPTGNFVYMNTVGCFTFPSVGDSDSIFKLDAATGGVVWKRRVTPPEQFGFCANDSGVDCGTDAHCAGVGGTCTTPKSFYHDFGFLNGPLPIDVPAAGGGTETLIVSGSKNGTLYALHETDGTIAWTNAVMPVPVTPGFAGFGLFNGAITYADGRIHAATSRMVPPRVCDHDHRLRCTQDSQCPGSTCVPEKEHLLAFDPSDGDILWSDEIGASWSSVAVVNGVVYAGTNDADGTTGASEFYAYDAAAGTRLATFDIPATSAARAAVTDDTLIVGYGVFSPGGVRAYSLCGNGEADPGETCDPGGTAAACCSAACQIAAPGTSCDDGDACTSADGCTGIACAGAVVTADDLACALARTDDAPCGAEALPFRLERVLSTQLAALDALVDKASALAAAGRADKLERVRGAMLRKLDAIDRVVAKLARARSERAISETCRAAVEARVATARALIAGFAF